MTDVKQLITEHLDIWLTAETAKKSGRGRSSGAKGTIYGVQKLRELILELAVTGKLTNHLDSDSNADEILKIVAEEKDSLVANGKLKKVKYTFLENSPDTHLPSNWMKVFLGELTLLITDGTHYTPTYLETGVPFISVKDVSGKTISFNDCKYISEQEHSDLIKRCKPEKNDILLCRIGTLGRATRVDTDREFSIFVSLGLLKLSKRVHYSEYLHIFLHSPQALSQFEEIKIGGSHTNKLNLKDLPHLYINLPPLEEQQRIVEKVDELMQLCDQLEQQQSLSSNAHATLVETLLKALTESSDDDDFQGNWQRIVANFDLLFSTEHSIEQLKQSVLQLAVMGKLVKQAPSDEPASELLKKIADEKAKLVKDGVLKKRSKNYNLPSLNIDFPSDWVLVNLDQIIWNLDAGWSPACHPHPAKRDKWGVLKTTFVQCNYFIKDENKELPENLNPRVEAELKSGDILVTRAGPYNRVGVACYVDKIRPKLMISDKLIRISYSQQNLYGAFIALAINFGITRNYLKDNQSGMAESQVNISQEKLREAPVLLPPLNEQKRIVEKVNQLFSMIEQLQALQSKLQKTKLHLADALVANAVENV